MTTFKHKALTLALFLCCTTLFPQAFATDLILHPSVEKLHKMGYTGKGVKVGIIDDFTAEKGKKSHGDQVVAALKKVAPEAKVIVQKVSVLKHTIRNDLIKKMPPSGIINVKNTDAKVKLNLLRKDKTPSEHLSKPGYQLARAYRGHFCKKDLFDEIDVPNELTLRVLNGEPYAEITVNETEYYLSFSQLQKKGNWQIMPKSELTRSIADSFHAMRIRDLIRLGVKIISYSLDFAVSQKAVQEAIQDFSNDGGIWVMASGNEPQVLGEPISIEHFKLADDAPHYPLMKSEACIMAGALSSPEAVADYSARARYYA